MRISIISDWAKLADLHRIASGIIHLGVYLTFWIKYKNQSSLDNFSYISLEALSGEIRKKLREISAFLLTFLSFGPLHNLNMKGAYIHAITILIISGIHNRLGVLELNDLWGPLQPRPFYDSYRNNQMTIWQYRELPFTP